MLGNVGADFLSGREVGFSSIGIAQFLLGQAARVERVGLVRIDVDGGVEIGDRLLQAVQLQIDITPAVVNVVPLWCQFDAFIAFRQGLLIPPHKT